MYPYEIVGIDTNVLLRATLNDDPAQTPMARAQLQAFTPERQGFIAQVTLLDYYWTLSRSYKYTKAECLAAINALLETRTIEIEDGESVALAVTRAEAGADFADALIACTNELFGASETVTFDRKASDVLGWKLLTT